MTKEKQRIEELRQGKADWQKWGPYLSERQWGTVREDYSANSEPWDYFTHNHARSRAYRWGEDGLAGISDDQQRLCFSVALWNGRDPILKERLFGLANEEGNHGEDVKELYYYLDATPTHSYLKMLYKYPQQAFPYRQLVDENKKRDRQEDEYELLDTGVFDNDQYFDVFVEYAKATPHDILICITAHNRGPEPADLHLLPQLWFRNTWSWSKDAHKPEIRLVGENSINAKHNDLGEYYLHTPDTINALFCENETNEPLLFGKSSKQGFFKDAIHNHLTHGELNAVNPMKAGTKVAIHHPVSIPAGNSIQVKLRLSDKAMQTPWDGFDAMLEKRRLEADVFYAELNIRHADTERKNIQRQALAGMIWSKQYYHYDVYRWFKGDPSQPKPPAQRHRERNHNWQHLHAAEILSMPDAWEFPWFASWDLAIQCIPLSLIDAQFAKSQLITLMSERYMDHDGELPAYEWAFSDANPPVYAWAAWKVFEIDRQQRGNIGDLQFLERIFHKLLFNFSWWVNRKDGEGRNLFQGGFLGLDNIGVFDRSKPLPGGGRLDQADATSWMAMYCLNLMRIALELALHNPSYEDIAIKFFEHFLNIAKAVSNVGESGIGMWDEQEQFFYSMLHAPDGRTIPIRAHTVVGLIPLLAVEVIEADSWERLPGFARRLKWYQQHRPDLCNLISPWQNPSRDGRRLLALLRGERMKAVLRRMLDETHFLSGFGIRSVSKGHQQEPYTLWLEGKPLVLDYQPGESTTNLFGGNSNWRGPLWFPINYLIIESLRKFHVFYGDDFMIEYPTGSKNLLSLNDVADNLSERLGLLFLKNDKDRRAVFGHYDKLQQDPHFQDYLLFYEYFHADTGRGCGASHQTGWTGLIAALL